MKQMVSLQSHMKHQKSGDDSESLTPSALLDLTDQSHRDFSSEMSNTEHLNAEHPFPIDDVSWIENYSLLDYLTSDQSDDTWDKSLNALGVACSPLHLSEVLQPLSSEETLDVDLNAALISDELFQLFDQKPVHISEEHQQIYPSADLQPRPSEVPGSLVWMETFPNCPPYVFPHPTPAMPVLAASFNPHYPTPMEFNTIHNHPQNSPHFIHIPQLTYFPTIHQLNTNFNDPLIYLVKSDCTCLMHQPNPSYPFHPPHVNVSFSPHLSVLNPDPPTSSYLNTAVHQPMNAVRHPEVIQAPHSSQSSWAPFNTSFPHDVHQNFRLWQRFCETARDFYSSTPNVEALACFFIHVIGSLTHLHSDLLFDTAVNVAIQEWSKTSTYEREKYYTAAKQFIELRKQHRRNTRAKHLKTKHSHKTSARTYKPRGGVLRYSSGKEKICQDLPAHDLTQRALEEVMNDLKSEVTEGHQVNTEACVQYLNEVFNQNEFISQDHRIQKAHQVSITPPALTNSLLQEIVKNDGHLMQHQDHSHHTEFQMLSTLSPSFSPLSGSFDQGDWKDHSSFIRDGVQSAPQEISLDVHDNTAGQTDESNSQSVCFSLQNHNKQATNHLTMKHCLGESSNSNTVWK
ncbi:uncharacterized protein [Misgurnus anguillicaudatus]|uniref:uncharacterized protein isoform X1 n=1 Tax=Misgurnus anguillicaudatus TaxID=75329 RepID=UPI003CCF0898